MSESAAVSQSRHAGRPLAFILTLPTVTFQHTLAGRRLRPFPPSSLSSARSRSTTVAVSSEESSAFTGKSSLFINVPAPSFKGSDLLLVKLLGSFCENLGHRRAGTFYLQYVLQMLKWLDMKRAFDFIGCFMLRSVVFCLNC